MAWLPRDTDLKARDHWVAMAKHALNYRRVLYARRQSFGESTSKANKKIMALWVIRWQPYFDLEEDD